MLEISTEELAEIVPRLLGSGAGALGWWRVRLSELKTDPVAFPLQQAYRLHTLQAALRETRRPADGRASWFGRRGGSVS